MKRVMLAVLMVVGMLGIAHASPTAPATKAPASAQCKYKVEDARAGLKGLTMAGFIPRGQSEDGNRVLGLMLFHNPASKDAGSVDALALVMVDKTVNKEITFAVVYIGPKKSVVFKRQLKEGGKELSLCFDKTLEDNPKEKQ